MNEKILSEINGGSIIVDFGCGSMPYRKLFGQKFEKYIGVDFPANKEADLHLENGRIPLMDNSVDFVISTQVLEHVENPAAYLRECFRIMKNDGRLLLSTHGHWMYHPDPTDFWRWTKDGLEKLLEQNGWEVIKTYGLMGLSASGLQLFQDGLARRLHPRLRSIFFRVIAFLQTRLDKWNMESVDASVFYTVSKKRQ